MSSHHGGGAAMGGHHMGGDARALKITSWLTGKYFVIELGIGIQTGSVELATRTSAYRPAVQPIAAESHPPSRVTWGSKRPEQRTIQVQHILGNNRRERLTKVTPTAILSCAAHMRASATFDPRPSRGDQRLQTDTPSAGDLAREAAAGHRYA